MSTTPTLGQRYEMVPAPAIAENTEYVECGALSIGIEFRMLTEEVLAATYAHDARANAIVQAAKLPVVDESGVSFHIHDAATGHEVLRFDVLDDHPHYHYINPEGFNVVVLHDEVATGPMLPWAFDAMRSRMAEMVRFAGATELADRVDAATVESVMPAVIECGERALRRGRGEPADAATGRQR